MSRSESQRTMTFWEHLGELRNRIFYSLIGVAVCGAVAWSFRERLYDLLVLPLRRADPDAALNVFGVTEAFFTFVRIAFFGGLVLASPFVLYQAWAFVAPALKPHEKRITAGMLLPVALLFILGVCFIYFILLPFSIGFLLGFSPEGLEYELSQDKYFGFITGLCLAGGLLFELPVIMGLLGWLGLVTPHWLLQKSGIALVLLMIVAAVITPTGDAFNMLAFTAPLMILYLLGVAIVWLIQRFKRAKPTAGGV